MCWPTVRYSLVVNTNKPVVEEDTEAIDETENTTTYASFRKPQVRQIWSKQGQEQNPGL